MKRVSQYQYLYELLYWGPKMWVDVFHLSQLGTYNTVHVRRYLTYMAIYIRPKKKKDTLNIQLDR